MKEQINNVGELLEQLFAILESHLGEEDEGISKAAKAANYSSVQIADDAQTLNDTEKEIIKNAALERETGLTALRKNELDAGKQSLQKAKEMIANATISKEGILIADTYQQAAVAFLHLKNKDFDSAIRATGNALDTHKELFLHFGHPIETRRVHLARNIAKVLSMAGKTEEAMTLSANLIQYVIDKNHPWQLEYGQLDQPDEMSLKQKYFVLDQVLNEIGYLLSNNLVSSDKALQNLQAIVETMEKSTDENFKIILNWTQAYFSFLQNDTTGFLQNSIEFHSKYSNQLPKAYNFLLTCLSELVE